MANTKLKHLHPLFIQDRLSGMMGNEIAKKYNVNNVTVWNVLKKNGLSDRFTLEERFWKNVNVLSQYECWEWAGCKFKGGYGALGYNKKTEKAHRISYKIHKGDIQENLVVRHTCDNPSCVNPNHLIVGTHAENMKDRDERNRSHKGSKHYKAKLNETSVLKIIDLYKNGHTKTELARIFNVTTASIIFIINKKTWKHVIN